jgi:hypothetical protein
VPEYDAFGREIGEDPLGSLRQPGEAAPGDQEEAALQEARAARAARADEASDAANAFGAAQPAARRDDAVSEHATRHEALPGATAPSGSARGAEAAPGATGSAGRAVQTQVFVGHRRAGRGGVVAALAITATIVVGVFGVIVFAIVGAGSAVIDQIDDFAPPEVDAAAQQPVGLGAGSLLRPSAFERAIATLRDAGGRATLLRVAPARIDTQLARGNRTRIVQVQPGGDLREIATVSGAGSGRAGLDWDRIDPRAPERLTRAAARRLKITPRRIDYLVLNGDPVQWSAHFQNGRIAIGDRRGRVTRILPE